MAWLMLEKPKFRIRIVNDWFGYQAHEFCGVCGSKKVKNTYELKFHWKKGSILLRRNLECRNGCIYDMFDGDYVGKKLSFSNGTFGLSWLEWWNKNS